MSMPQQRPNDNVSNGAQSGGMSQQNLNGIVRLLLFFNFAFFCMLVRPFFSLFVADCDVPSVKLED